MELYHSFYDKTIVFLLMLWSLFKLILVISLYVIIGIFLVKIHLKAQRLKQGQTSQDFLCELRVATKPPTFVIFVNEEELMHFSYLRFLENQIRKAFVFEGTPIHLIARKRK